MNPRTIEPYVENIDIERVIPVNGPPTVSVIVYQDGEAGVSLECESEQHAYALAGLLARCTKVTIA